MIGNKYKIEVSYPGRGFTQSFPVNNSLEWVYEREDGQLFFRKKLSTKLTFKDDPAIPSSDFTDLYTVERSANSRCDKIDVIVYKRCSKNGSWEEHYHGYLSMIDGEWNKSHCVVDIPIRAQDQYTCFFENWEKDINIFQLPNLDRYDSRSTIGVIEYKECNVTVSNIGDDAANECGIDTDLGWTLVKLRIHTVIYNGVQTVNKTSTWARETFIGSQPGLDWILDGGAWVRSPEVVEDKLAEVYTGNLQERFWNIVQYNLTNGLKLSSVIEEMIKWFRICNYSVVSNLLGINPDGTAPTNIAYNFAFDHLRNLYIYDKEDVLRAKDKTQSSTGARNPISIKRMIQNIKALFNAEFIIEENTNVVRIEHITYFLDNRMLDLTQARFLKDIEGKWKYTYEKEKLPIKEFFEFMEPTIINFDGVPIEYDESCSSDDPNNTTTIKADYVVTAVDDVVEFPVKYTDKGFVIVERSNTGYIVSGNSFSSVDRNGNLSWPRLQENFYKWRRPQSKGKMNQQFTNFFTYKRTRKQDPIQIQLCCSDYTNFNPKDLVKTQLGWGEILTAKYSEPSEVLTVELLHD